MTGWANVCGSCTREQISYGSSGSSGDDAFGALLFLVLLVGAGIANCAGCLK